MLEFINYIHKLTEGYERGQGIEPLIQEFVDEVYNIDKKDADRRKKSITAYYMRCDRKLVALAIQMNVTNSYDNFLAV